MESTILSSVISVLEDLEFLNTKKSFGATLIKKLRALRTFLLCTLHHKDENLGSFMVKIEDVVWRNAGKIKPYRLSLEEGCSSSDVVAKIADFLREIESFEDDIDEWYTNLSDFSRRSSLTAYELLRLNASIIGNILDYWTSRRHYDKLLADHPIEALLDNLVFLRNFIQFVKLQSVEPPKLEDLLSHFEAVAVNTAHLFAHLLYTCDTCRGCRESDPEDDDPCNEMWDGWSEEKISVLLNKIKPFDPQVCKTYTQALLSLKLSLQLNTSTHENENVEDSVTVMNEFIDSLLGICWKELELMSGYIFAKNKDHLSVLYKGLKFLKTNMKEEPHKCVKKTRHLIEEVICDAAITIFSLYQTTEVNFQGVLEAMEVIRAEIEGARSTNETDGFNDKGKDVKKVLLRTDEVIGFDDVAISIIDRLTRGSQQLQIIAIVGMAGLGKTTLATKVYDDPSVTYYFHVRARCTVSLAFNKKEVLLELLNHLDSKLPAEQYLKMSEQDHLDSKLPTEQDLVQDLWRRLKRRRYLIFLDDVWDSEAWNCLQEAFPNDSNGSRIILTSRYSHVAPQTMLDGEPHSLRQLTVGESWELLQNKLFHVNGCPPTLHELGMQIAGNCKGLPLTIIIVAGLLTTLEQERWQEVLESLTSDIVSGTEQCMNSLELSYKHLPDYLKPCFLYFGLFPEDEVVSTKVLIWLWIAEGLIQKANSEGLEELGMNYVMDLISRSLVMVVSERSSGGVKTCRIHDLLQAFCITKAKEENFFHLLKGNNDLLAFNEPSNLQRLCIQSKPEDFKQARLFCPRVKSLLFFSQRNMLRGDWLNISFIVFIFKLLKVLDIRQINLGYKFPLAVTFLQELRFLAVRGEMEEIPWEIFRLSNLEIFIVHPLVRVIYFPDTLWFLKRLRHIHTNASFYFAGSCLSTKFIEYSSTLDELESYSGLVISRSRTMKKELRKFPNIRKLKCKLFEDWPGENLGKIVFPDFLSRLESLHLSPWVGTIRHSEFVFPENLKKLTLAAFEIPWSKFKDLRIGKLPNLEVLKLLHKAFLGETWEMEEGDFSKLRFLKLDSLNIVKWTGSDDDDGDLPCLEKLVLENCNRLEEIPGCLNTIPDLRMIEVSSCYRCIAAVEQVQEMQREYGNSALEIFVRSRYENT